MTPVPSLQDLERNDLEEIPAELAWCQKLLVLNVAYCGTATDVPEELCKSLSLEELVVGRNTVVPVCFAAPSYRQLQIILRP